MSPRPSVGKPKYYRIGENGERIEIDGPLTPNRPITSNMSTNASPTPRLFGESSIGMGQGLISNSSHIGTIGGYMNNIISGQGISIPIQ
jgi:hypothetical protein